MPNIGLRTPLATDGTRAISSHHRRRATARPLAITFDCFLRQSTKLNQNHQNLESAIRRNSGSQIQTPPVLEKTKINQKPDINATPHRVRT